MEQKTKQKAAPKQTIIRSACEEYVVEALKEAKKIIVELQIKLSQSDFTIDQLEKKHAVMLGYLLLVFSKSAGSYVKVSDNLVSVYVLNNYIGIFNQNNIETDKDKRLYAVWQIIEKVNEKPTKE